MEEMGIVQHTPNALAMMIPSDFFPSPPPRKDETKMKLEIPTHSEWNEKLDENGKKVFTSHYICPIHRTRFTRGICEHLAICEQCGPTIVYLILKQPESLIKRLNPKR